ncbi:MAG: hypothetical protein JNM68_16825 [Dinghuibacter sp.]|nr:hypothetical protein [Dinghuibacter sp.]
MAEPAAITVAVATHATGSVHAVARPTSKLNLFCTFRINWGESLLSPILKHYKMKIYLLTVISLVMLSGNTVAQEKDMQLYHFIKTWGAIKYYHPKIKKGSKDWNMVFRKIASRILEENKLPVATIVDELLNEATRPEFTTSGNTRYNEYREQPFANLDFSWINNKELEIKEQDREYLYQMVTNYNPGKNRFNKSEINKYYFNTRLEKFWYPSNYYPGKTDALLSLAKYWNIINYFDPHKENFSQSWDSTLAEFIPRILETSGSINFYKTFASLTAHINDSHGFYYNYEFDSLIGLKEPGIMVKHIENKFTAVSYVSDTLHKITGISPGDVITKINGIDVGRKRAELSAYFSGSREKTVNREVNSVILKGDFGKKYTIEYINKENKIHTGEFVLSAETALKNVNTYNKQPVRNFTEHKAVYLKLADATKKTVNKAIREANHDATRYLILDFRYGGHRTRWNHLLGKFTNKRVTVARYYDCSFSYPGHFSEKLIRKKSFLSFLSSKYRKNVIALVNENVQSSLEFNLMMLKAAVPNMVIIGQNTAGADGAATSVLVQNNILTYFTRDVVLFPDNTKTQGTGIVPDILVEETLNSLREGKDAILERALNYIKFNK